MSAARDDDWEIFDDDRPFAGAIYGAARVRMALVGLGGGALLVVSPGAPLSDARAERLARWGSPRFLLAPNHFHNGGIAVWKTRYPDARVVAHPRAQKRLRKKVPGVAIEDLALLEPALPAGVRIFGPPMAKQGETWVSLATAAGRAWFVTDGILNAERLPRGATGLVLRLLGFRTGLMTNPFFKRLFLTDKAAYKAWLCAERERPTLFVPAHGAVLRGPEVWRELIAVTESA